MAKWPKCLPPHRVILASNQEAPYWLRKDTICSRVIQQMWLLLLKDRPAKALELLTSGTVCNEGKISSKLVYKEKTRCNEVQMRKHNGNFHKSAKTLTSSKTCSDKVRPRLALERVKGATKLYVTKTNTQGYPWGRFSWKPFFAPHLQRSLQQLEKLKQMVQFLGPGNNLDKQCAVQMYKK